MNSTKPEFVVDTNVPIVANGNQTPQADWNCRLSCIDNLERVQSEGVLLMDEKFLIFQEYSYYLSPSGEPGVGDRFFQWLLLNQGNEQLCRMIPITTDPNREFTEFPDDPALASFDRSDRKFVAVALASESAPEILNATDTDWWYDLEALQRHGVNVTFLCPELMLRQQ